MQNSEKFIQQQAPQLLKFLQISQPQSDISLQFWNHLVDFIEIPIPTYQKNLSPTQIKKNNSNFIQYLIAKSKQGTVTIWKFRDNCLVMQKCIKLVHALKKQITTIKLRFLQNKKQDICLVLLGYYDGVVEIYQLKEIECQLMLTKYLSIKNSTQQGVSNILTFEQSVYILKSSKLFIYQNILAQVLRKIILSLSQPITSFQTILSIQQLKHTKHLNIFINKNLFLYNEIEGVYSFSLPDLKESGTVMDSVGVVAQTDQTDLFVGSTDDNFKIIYQGQQQITRFVGLKSFVHNIIPITYQYTTKLYNQSFTQVWIADLYGMIHYLKKKKNSNSPNQKNINNPDNKKMQKKQMAMIQEQLNFGIKISEQGIKKLIVTSKMLIIVDCQMNIILFDIIRNVNPPTSRQI